MAELKTKGAAALRYLEVVPAEERPRRPPFARYRCAGCSDAPACEFAFDDYNLDGDCLAEK